MHDFMPVIHPVLHQAIELVEDCQEHQRHQHVENGLVLFPTFIALPATNPPRVNFLLYKRQLPF